MFSASRFSRRKFLQLTGIVLLGTTLTPSAALLDDLIPAVDTFQGRALNSLAIFRSPHLAAPVVSHMWADSVVTLLEKLNDWYLLPQGYAPVAHIQPMTEYASTVKTAPPALPCWMEVSAPVAVVREWCAADAPLITRIGHGGVARIIDRMPDGRGGLEWYGVAVDDSAALLGWSQVAGWRPVENAASAAPKRAVHIDLHQQQLTALEDDCVVLISPVSAGKDIALGDYRPRWRSPASTLGEHRGVPWIIDFGAGMAAGAYWHNQFGQSIEGSTVQMPPVLARWLYTWLGEDGHVVIV